ncbi:MULTISPECIES: ATP-binding protein [unclassified Pedobacter]|uniref:tetratricopeptide repeat-containing sensor histidine kinase n=1 Tax=unclassified Pedobacter TaxID=2628915 RepID=UPI001422FE88|nr:MULTISPECIES: ATP-binding protein [unclassified Pedobacter]NII84254.1 two-component sensor histidine kinase [Pedobacter sp. SG908]NMN38831.1 two-component sensor histidine kinase [Pedobacter sp. SG918]
MKRFSISILCVLMFTYCSKRKLNVANEISNPNFNSAVSFYQKNMPDSAFAHFNDAKSSYLESNDSVGAGKSLIYMAIISIESGDYFGGQEIALQALNCFNTSNKKHFKYLCSNYHELGVASSFLKNYKQAIYFYTKSIAYADSNNNLSLVENSLALTYRDLNNYQESLKLFRSILRKKLDKTDYSRTLSNYAYTMWKHDPKYNARTALLKALSIRKSAKDLWGQNASYAHLSEYYEMKHPDTALIYAIKMYEVAKAIESSDDQLQALQKLIRLSPDGKVKSYYTIYQKLDDSLQNARRAAKNQFAVIRYETEKNKADNLVLQKDNEEKKYQVIILAFGILLFAVAGTLWYRKRKQKLELEAKNSIRDSQIKTSKKVHDKVANKIYRVMSEVENKNDLDRNHLLDQLEYIYNTSRDISYEITDDRLNKTFRQQLSDLFSAYVASTRSIDVTGNEDDLWANVPENTASEIFIILLELMNNMKKHSQATEVKIKFNRSHNIISIKYHDNGIGLPEQVLYNNGLRNTETRIKNISGTITFETMDKNGLGISISFPIR